ncbi:anti-sigma factor antagonist [Streptomyces sp. NPDC005808]|uniref:anti-sigma factor antagonist n=1 Tax=Streptomyces sp. NPDC005808 TaxID=3364734 RepID=UPI0036C2D59E
MPEHTLTAQLKVADEVHSAPPDHSASGHQGPLLGIEAHPAGDWTLVVVSGAIDIVTEQALHNGLRQALARSARGIDLDLSGVDFCDCSGLNVLLHLRRRALDEGKTIAIQATSTAVRRLFSVTGTLSLFAVAGEADEAGRTRDTHSGSAHRTGGDTTSLGEANQDLRIELVQLRRALQTRPVIDLARGVLMASFGLSAEDAWKVLVSVSQHTNTKLHHVADNLVNAVTGDALAESFQSQVSDSVTTLRTAPSVPATSCVREGVREG